LWIDRLDPAYPLLTCRTCQVTWTPEGLGDLRTIPLAIHDASALTGLSERLLRHAIHRGRIPAHHDGHRIRIVLADIWRWRISA
jgi:excisionase family DNA binding protein